MATGYTKSKSAGSSVGSAFSPAAKKATTAQTAKAAVPIAGVAKRPATNQGYTRPKAPINQGYTKSSSSQPISQSFSASPSDFGGGGGGGGGMPGGGGGGGGFGGGSASDFVAAPVPAMQDITIPDAMAEQSYQEQVAALARNMSDFKAQQDLADNQYTGSFNQGARKLGVNGEKFDRNLAGGQYGQTVAANENDFAARGGLRSGLFVNSQAQIDNDFNSRLGEMQRARGDFRDTAALSRQNLESQNEIARQQALQSAVAAVAARYGVNSDQVGRGAPNTIQRAV